MKFNLYKKHSDILSKRCLTLIRKNYNLSVLVELLPKNIIYNENYIYLLLLENNDLEIEHNYIRLISKIHQYSLPYSEASLFKIFKNLDFDDIVYSNYISCKIDTNLLKYRKVKKANEFICSLNYVSHKLDAPFFKFKGKDSLSLINNETVTIQKDTYSFKLIQDSRQLSLWSLYLNNCLNGYANGKKMKIFCSKTQTNHSVSYEICLKKNLLSLICVMKNGKPYCCLELVDSSDNIRQILGKKNKFLFLTEQHALLSKIDKILGKELSWVKRTKND
jgi:hypothetical protein